MANLYFPQLASGAIAQYPILKTAQIRTVKNVYADGSITAWPDQAASALEWQLSYSGLSLADLTALQSFFAQCCGSFRAFTFIDPTGNMLVSSSDLTAAAWNASPGLVLTPNVADPFGGTAAFQLSNTSQVTAQIAQTLQVPANYQYCFSAYLLSAQAATVNLTRTGSTQTGSSQVSAVSSWTRFISSGSLADPGTTVTVSLSIAPGQVITVYGPQLEPQIAPSNYRPTTAAGSGVYPNSHFGMDAFPISAEASGAFATAITIQTLI